MRHVTALLVALALFLSTSVAAQTTTQDVRPPDHNPQNAQSATQSANQSTAAGPIRTPVRPILGFRSAPPEYEAEQKFLAVPDPKLAEEHLRALTAVPHIAGSPEDRKTAEYVAQKYREAGLRTDIVEYKVWMNYPAEISVDLVAPANAKMHGPTREHVADDPFQDDPRVVMPFNGFSPSGDVEAEVVYANYGRPEDFNKLKELKVDLRGKIALVRYGQNFRGVKSFVGQENGVAGVIIYSDPIDDGWFKGDKYPQGPWRPDTGVQRGSVGYMFQFPGDPTTPDVASTPDLTDDKRTPPAQSAELPKVPTTPISYQDAWPILQSLAGPASPRAWQGALPFTYHVGPGPARVKMHLKQDYAYRSIWNVIGKITGSEFPDEWVVAGNHRDAWVYGAVDPNSGTAAQLETVHGLGELLKTGWRPKRTIVIASWDAEEQGLIGSTEWVEQNRQQLADAAAYFNMDVGVAGQNFNASAVPSLKDFMREATKAVMSPKGGTVYDVWRTAKEKEAEPTQAVAQEVSGSQNRMPAAQIKKDVPVGDLGSGSDYTAFLQHLGVPSADITSSGSYGVYHSVFDNFAWFKKFADPTFIYEQQMARVYGVQILRMANADVLPYNYEDYGKEIGVYIEAAQKKAASAFGAKAPSFAAVADAAKRLVSAGAAAMERQRDRTADASKINAALLKAERAFLLPHGLPNRPWFRHAIYAPGQYTGYAAVVIPGVNEAIDAKDLARTQQQIAALATALNRAAETLKSVN
jgi:N-acetylated-alpha-linked acidic dipeptidase